MADQNMDDDSQNDPLDDSIIKPEPAEQESTQVGILFHCKIKCPNIIGYCCITYL